MDVYKHFENGQKALLSMLVSCNRRGIVFVKAETPGNQGALHARIYKIWSVMAYVFLRITCGIVLATYCLLCMTLPICRSACECALVRKKRSWCHLNAKVNMSASFASPKKAAKPVKCGT